MRGIAGTVLLLANLTACTRGHEHEKPPIHPVMNMDVQPRAAAQGPSEFFADGKALRPKLAGTVAREDPIDDGGLATGRDDAGEYLVAAPIPLGPRALARGEERYGIFCAPCHGDSGDGQGMLTARAGVRVTSLMDPRLIAAPDGQLVETITQGLGLMPAYAAQVPPEDRWAIVAYVRQLQEAAPSGSVEETDATAGEGVAPPPAGPPAPSPPTHAAQGPRGYPAGGEGRGEGGDEASEP